MLLPTYTAKEPEQMTSEELITELICQRHIARFFRTRAYRAKGIIHKDREALEAMENQLRECEPESEEYKTLHYKTARKRKALERAEQKLEFCEIYERNIRGFIDYLTELKEERKVYELAHRQRGYDPRSKRRKEETAELKELRGKLALKKKLTKKQIRQSNKAGAVTTWNRESFDLVVRDRGFFTEAGLLSELSKHLGLTIRATEELLKSGRFTMEQVLLIGDFFQMTPKEFCDIFLRDYFTDFCGNYIAEYK